MKKRLIFKGTVGEFEKIAKGEGYIKEEEFLEVGDKVFCSDYGSDEITTEEYDYAQKKWEELKQKITGDKK